VFGAFGLAVAGLAFLLGAVAPRRTLVWMAGALPLLPILTAVIRGPEISWAEPLWLGAASGALLAASLGGRDEEPPPSAVVFLLALFVAWAAASAGAAIWPWLPPGFRGGLMRHLLASAMTLLDAVEPYYPVRAAFVLFEAFVGLLLAAIFLRDPRWRRALRRAVLGSAGLVALYAVVEQIFHLKLWPAFHYDVVSGFRRVASTLPDPNALGSFLALALLWAAGTRRESRGKRRDLYLVLFGLLLFALFLSGSRIAWLAVGLLGAGEAWRRRAARESSPAGRRAILVALLVAAIAFSIPAVQSRLVLTFSSSSVSDLLLGRTGFFRAGGRMIAAHPWAGVGEGRFYRDLNAYRDPDFWIRHENAHDYFLQVFAETGLPGGLLFLSAVALAFRRGERDLPGLGLGLAAFAATLLSGHALLVPEVAILVAILVGCREAARPEAFRRPSRRVLAAALAAGVAVGCVVLVARASGQPTRFGGYGVWPVSEPGGPNGLPQYWTEDLFAVPWPDVFAREPVPALAVRARVRNLASGRDYALSDGWVSLAGASTRPRALADFRWFRANVLWCPAALDAKSRDRRLLSIRVAGGVLPAPIRP
jgi:O-antigen ligase